MSEKEKMNQDGTEEKAKETKPAKAEKAKAKSDTVSYTHLYFRSSMQNMGGSAGFSRGRSVSWSRGRLGLADSSRRQLPARPRICSRISSRLGW